MRVQTHIIDTKAVKKVIGSLPDSWVVRELTERDYGIDLMVEIFVPGLKDGKGKDAYDSTGAVFHIQIKGTESELRPTRGTINYSIHKNSLSYVEKFSVPFFLFRVDVSNLSGQIYFIWIQRYIKDVLDVETPFWREDSKKHHITVRIPTQNKVESNFSKIQTISFRPKYIEELIEYREIFGDLDDRISAIFAGQHTLDSDVVDDLRNKAYRIQRLNVLLAQNDCCINRTCVDNFINFLDELANNTTRLNCYPHHHNFSMLANSLDSLSSVENFIQENDGRSAY